MAGGQEEVSGGGKKLMFSGFHLLEGRVKEMRNGGMRWRRSPETRLGRRGGGGGEVSE